MSRQHGTSIEIREVAGKKALNLFICVPWSVYKNDPHWVPHMIEKFGGNITKHYHNVLKKPGQARRNWISRFPGSCSDASRAYDVSRQAETFQRPDDPP